MWTLGLLTLPVRPDCRSTTVDCVGPGVDPHKPRPILRPSMIIADDQQPDSLQKSLKSGTSSTIRPVETPNDPPSYDDAIVSSSPASPISSLASPMLSSSYYNYQAISPSTAPLPQGSDVGSTKRARRRFLGGLGLGLIIYITIASFLRVHHESQVKASDVYPT